MPQPGDAASSHAPPRQWRACPHRRQASQHSRRLRSPGPDLCHVDLLLLGGVPAVGGRGQEEGKHMNQAATQVAGGGTLERGGEAALRCQLRPGPFVLMRRLPVWRVPPQTAGSGAQSTAAQCADPEGSRCRLDEAHTLPPPAPPPPQLPTHTAHPHRHHRQASSHVALDADQQLRALEGQVPPDLRHVHVVADAAAHHQALGCARGVGRGGAGNAGKHTTQHGGR